MGFKIIGFLRLTIKICTILVEHLPLGFSSERKKWGTVLVVVFIQIENWGLRTRCLSFFIKKMIVDIKLELVNVTTCCRKEEQHLSCSIVKKPQKQGSCFCFVFYVSRNVANYRKLLQNGAKILHNYRILLQKYCKCCKIIAACSKIITKCSKIIAKCSKIIANRKLSYSVAKSIAKIIAYCCFNSWKKAWWCHCFWLSKLSQVPKIFVFLFTSHFPEVLFLLQSGWKIIVFSLRIAKVTFVSYAFRCFTYLFYNMLW